MELHAGEHHDTTRGRDRPDLRMEFDGPDQSRSVEVAEFEFALLLREDRTEMPLGLRMANERQPKFRQQSSVRVHEHRVARGLRVERVECLLHHLPGERDEVIPHTRRRLDEQASLAQPVAPVIVRKRRADDDACHKRAPGLSIMAWTPTSRVSLHYMSMFGGSTSVEDNLPLRL